MTTIQIIVTLGGIALSGFIAWFFWLAPKGQTRILAGKGGVQEVAITVKGGYTPDIIVVKAGQPLRMRFTRQESSSCSETVLFPDFNRSAKLPEGEEVVVEFTPDKSGEFGFQCQMGMLRGKLIVE
ncbi:MAG: cupredoxin domain-containing protein [Chloroflexi bacterium]|nr:cupredoxin domain-containing protein [Chloroflexota bacterium]